MAPTAATPTSTTKAKGSPRPISIDDNPHHSREHLPIPSAPAPLTRAGSIEVHYTLFIMKADYSSLSNLNS